MSYDTSKIVRLGQVKSAMQRAQAYTAAVASAAADAIEDLIPESVNMTIPVNGWVNGQTQNGGTSSVYPYYYDYEVSGITANNRAEITIAVGSVKAATSCGLCPTNETMSGYIRIRAAHIPTTAISAVALIS